MHAIKIQRAVRKQSTSNKSEDRRSIREFGRDFFAREHQIEFAIEALLFGVLVVISTWPIVAAAGAISERL